MGVDSGYGMAVKLVRHLVVFPPIQRARREDQLRKGGRDVEMMEGKKEYISGDLDP